MFKKKDLLLIAIVLIIAGGMAFFMGLGNDKSGEIVRVMIEGDRYGEYPINKNTTIDVENERGFNKIVIKNGSVYMEEADCPDKYCVEHKAITGTNETIVCLPHKLVVEIVSDDKIQEFDSVTQ